MYNFESWVKTLYKGVKSSGFFQEIQLQLYFFARRRYVDERV